MQIPGPAPRDSDGSRGCGPESASYLGSLYDGVCSDHSLGGIATEAGGPDTGSPAQAQRPMWVSNILFLSALLWLAPIHYHLPSNFQAGLDSASSFQCGNKAR